MTQTAKVLGKVWRAVWPHLSGQRARERKWRPQTYILAARRDTVWHVDLRDDPAIAAYIASLDGLGDDAGERTVVIARSVRPSGEPTLKISRVTGELLGYLTAEDEITASELMRVYEVSRLRYHMLRELRFRVQLHGVDGDPLRAELWIQKPIKITDAYWVKEPLPTRNNGF
ncbi:MAG: hypothetical protein WD360_00840 [Nitriliruptoraceae bacterium]